MCAVARKEVKLSAFIRVSRSSSKKWYSWRRKVDEEKEMRVRNLNGASQLAHSNGTWLTHWEKFSGQTAYQCFVSGCRNSRSVGGLVQKVNPVDTNWYVIPLCEECNTHIGRELEIWDMAMLVPVNVAKITRMNGERSPGRIRRAAGSVS
jgi:hypothetical protein